MSGYTTGTHLRQRPETRCNQRLSKGLLALGFRAIAETSCNLSQHGRGEKMSDDAKFILGFG
jgi:hypothetical protein